MTERFTRIPAKGRLRSIRKKKKKKKRSKKNEDSLKRDNRSIYIINVLLISQND